LNVWIGSGACRYFSFEVAASVRDLEERLALATAIGERRYGMVRQRWHISVDQRPHKSQGLACGVENDLLREIRSVAAAAGCKLALVAPWLSAATHHPAVAAHRGGQLVVSEPDAITAVRERDEVRSVHSLSCNDGEDRDAVKRQLLESSGLGVSALSVRLTMNESRLASGSSERLLDLVEIEK
jgi:hypothetical protein